MIFFPKYFTNTLTKARVYTLVDYDFNSGWKLMFVYVNELMWNSAEVDVGLIVSNMKQCFPYERPQLVVQTEVDWNNISHVEKTFPSSCSMSYLVYQAFRQV